tara:strand:+ start:67 stop:522 length:456 start_codon:yes stop_codon:yes gene_type:complete
MTTFRNVTEFPTQNTTSGTRRRGLLESAQHRRLEQHRLLARAQVGNGGEESQHLVEERFWRDSILTSLNKSMDTKADVRTTIFLQGCCKLGCALGNCREKTIVEVVVAAANEAEAKAFSEEIAKPTFTAGVTKVLVESTDYFAVVVILTQP